MAHLPRALTALALALAALTLSTTGLAAERSDRGASFAARASGTDQVSRALGAAKPSEDGEVQVEEEEENAASCLAEASGAHWPRGEARPGTRPARRATPDSVLPAPRGPPSARRGGL